MKSAKTKEVTMPPTRILKIVLERCDNSSKNNVISTLRKTLKVQLGHRCDFLPATKKGKSKIVKEEGKKEKDVRQGSVGVCQRSGSAEDRRLDMKPLRKRVKIEATPKMKYEKEPDFDSVFISAKTVKSENFSTLSENLPNIQTHYYAKFVTESVDNRQTNMVHGLNKQKMGLGTIGRIKIEKEEEEKSKSHLTCELVANLPVLKNSEFDSKPLLEVVKCEESEASASFDLEPRSNCRPLILGDDSDEVMSETCFESLQEHRILSDISSEMKSSEKLFEGSAAVIESNRQSECLSSKINSRQTPRMKESDLGNNVQYRCGDAPPFQSYSSDEVICKKIVKGLQEHITSAKVDSKENSSLVSNSCASCPVENGEQKIVVKPLKNDSRGKRFECAHCAASFAIKWKLLQHLRKHQKLYSCSVSPAKVSLCDNWETRPMTYASEQRFECVSYDVHITNDRTQINRTKLHTVEKPFSCPRYSASFPHQTAHNHERLYMCVHCSAEFKKKQELAAHIITHSSETRHSCPLCLKVFKLQIMLTTHLQGHNKEQSFSQPSLLKPHQTKLHSAAEHENYTCDKCSAEFQTLADFQHHAKVHVIKRPLVCRTCLKKFKTKLHLLRHAALCANENYYQCTECPCMYKLLYRFKAHSRSHLNWPQRRLLRTK